jgi:integrase
MPLPTFAEASREWLAVYSAKRHSAAWHERSRDFLEDRVIPRLGHLPLDAVRRPDINALVRAYAEAGKAVTANHVLVTIRSVYGWYINARDYEGHNPALGIKRQRCTPKDRVLSAVELHAIWHASLSLGEWGQIIRLLMCTGQRPGEISCLSWSEIVQTPDGWRIELPKHRTKNRHPHVVPLPALAHAQLPEQRPGFPNLFGRGRGKAWNGWATGRRMLKAKLGGMPHWSPHDLRRSFVTHANELGLAQPHIIEAAVNHIGGAKAGVAGVYNRAKHLPERRALLEVWCKELERIVAL